MTDSPRYQAGDTVVVRVDHPPGHYRTPDYVKGKTGQIIALCGVFKNPEWLGHGGLGAAATTAVPRGIFTSPTYGKTTTALTSIKCSSTFMSTG